MSLFAIAYNLKQKIQSGIRMLVVTPFVSKSFQSCGKGFQLGKNCEFIGISNITCGDRVSFGPRNRIWTTRARVLIGNDVMFGPDVFIVTGNHRIDIPGRTINSIRDDEKRDCDDEDVIIHDDCWLGGRCTIMKGCTIAKGCVIAAGAIVTQSTEPYCVYGGIPAKKIGERFSYGNSNK